MASSLKERLASKRKELASRSSGGNFFTLKEGTTRHRLLPVGDDQEFAFEAVFFYLGQEIKGVISPATFGKRCAIMEAYNELSSSKDPDDRELAKKFKPQKKFFAPSIRYKDEKGGEVDDTGVKLLILTSGQYQELIDLYLDEAEAGDFTSADNGYDIKFGRIGKTKTDTEYTIRACKPTKGPKKYVKKSYNPEEMLKEIAPSYKETKELVERFLNVASTEDDEEDNKKSKKSKGNKKKKKNKDL